MFGRALFTLLCLLVISCGEDTLVYEDPGFETIRILITGENSFYMNDDGPYSKKQVTTTIYDSFQKGSKYGYVIIGVPDENRKIADLLRDEIVDMGLNNDHVAIAQSDSH